MAQGRTLLFVFVVAATAAGWAAPQASAAPQPGPIWYAALGTR
jgi:hypothetical protein